MEVIQSEFCHILLIKTGTKVHPHAEGEERVSTATWEKYKVHFAKRAFGREIL
jgi:hypothetical protein